MKNCRYLGACSHQFRHLGGGGVGISWLAELSFGEPSFFTFYSMISIQSFHSHEAKNGGQDISMGGQDILDWKVVVALGIKLSKSIILHTVYFYFSFSP